MKIKEEKPKPVIAEVIDHVISLHMGHDVYKSFFKGAIVEIEPIAFRNLERKGRVKAAIDPQTCTTMIPPISSGPAMPIERKKRKTKVLPLETKTASPEGDAV